MPKRSIGEVVMLPGWGSDAEYPRLNAALTAGGFAVHAVAPRWGSNFLGTLAGVADQVAALRVSSEAVVLGHSLGAVLAIGEVARRGYGGLVLCSPSPTGHYLKNEPPEAKQKHIDAIGSNMFDDLCTVDADCWLVDAKIPLRQAHVLLETTNSSLDLMRQRASTAARLLGVWVQNVDATHDLDGQPNYIDAAVGAVRELYSR